MSHHLYIGLGSNLGDRKAFIREALRLVDLCVGHVEHVSSLYETEPWGYESANTYLNCAACVTTRLSPHECLTITQQIEHMLGRTQKTVDGQYHDRPIDIDLLLYDNLQLSSPTLTLPHPRIDERDFVKLPLQEII